METARARLHPGHRGRDVSPPHGDTLSPQGSVKMEIPQVLNVCRNPKETNWFSPTPPLMLGFRSTLAVAALHLLKGLLMLCTGLIVN